MKEFAAPESLGPILLEYENQLAWLESLITDPTGNRYLIEKSAAERLFEYQQQLNRTRELLDYCGNPQQKFRSVHVAGTGGFLAVIVSGDIEVDPAVGDSPLASPAPGDADLVGAFLANGDFQAGTTLSQTDKQLVIYGTVAADIDLNGTGKVRFQRDMGVNNAVGPGVSVIWNPNLLLNFPAQLTDALTDWREVAP